LTAGRRAAREAARARRNRRGQAIAAISSVVVLGGLVALVLTSPGWPEVRDTFFSWTAFKDSFPRVLEGFWLDVRLFLIVEAVVLVLGLVVALVRTSGASALFPLRLLAAAYCDVFRGIPVIMLVYLVGFGIPALQVALRERLVEQGRFQLSSTEVNGERWLRLTVMAPATDERTIEELLDAIEDVAAG
jgi:polar amino acid transport system permease protein